MATNPDQWEAYGWAGSSAGALPTEPDMSSDEWDNPTAEPIEDIDAQLMDLASDSERQAVYLSPDQQEQPAKNPLGSVVIEDFDGKGGKLIARDQTVADKALNDQIAGVSLQKIIGGLTLSGTGKPSNPDALVVQKKTPEGAVMRESVVADAAAAAEVAVGWGEGVEITDIPSAVKRREDLINKYAKQNGLNSQLVADYMTQESGGISNRTSSAGAEGLMQLMPDTAADMGVTDRMDDEQSVMGGAKYLALLKKKYEGNRELMAAAYNWGMGNVDKAVKEHGANWKSVLPPETDKYLKDMAGRASGGLSESLAASHTGGYAIPTDESIAGAVDTVFNKNIPYLADDPVLGQLDWQRADQRQGGGKEAQPAYDQWEVYGPEKGAKKDDYGWGIKNALMRGVIRAGSFIDVAQGDMDEFAEGMEKIKEYGVSEEDTAKLEKIREGDGFWTTLGGLIAEPRLALQIVAESAAMSIAPLIGGTVGTVAGGAMTANPVGAIAGGALGAGLGSYATEYFASISEAVAEHGVDITNPDELRAAFADEAFMATAREHASDRAIGVAAFDALSMGIAGRIYRPIAGAKKVLEAGVQQTGRVATKTSSVVGGLSEVIAQGTAGALGEGAGSIVAGDPVSGSAMADEFVGELVPGFGEMAVNKALGKDLGGNKPEDTTPPPKKPKVKRNPDGSWSEVDALGDPADASSAGDVPADVEADIPDTGDVDVDAEGVDRVVETPPLESETATTSPPPTDKTAPTKAQEETSSEVVGEVDVDAMLAAAAAREDAADQEAAAAKDVPEDVTPLIDPKTLGPKITESINVSGAKGSRTIRTAWRGLMNSLAKRYPDAGLTVPSSRFTGTGIAKFFKKLQDAVDITTDLPEIKELLDQLSTVKKQADIINILGRVAAKVQASSPSLADAPIDSIAGQAQAAYNDFMAYFESHQRVSKAKKNKGQTVLAGSAIEMANKLGELAGATRVLLQEAYDAFVLEEAGIGANYGKTIEIALQAADAAQSPTEKKNSSGGKEKTIKYTHATLFKNAQELQAIVEKVVPLLAAAEAKSTAAKQKAGTRTKVEETSAVTEAPAKPKSKNSPFSEPVLDTPTETWSMADARMAAKALGIETHNKTKKELIDAVNRSVDAEIAAVKLQRPVPTAAEKAKAASRKKALREAQAGELSRQAENQREIDEARISDIAADEGKLTPAQRKHWREVNAQNRAEVEALVAIEDAEKLASKIHFDNALVGREATVAQLRKIAKTLGAKGYSKLTRYGVEVLVAEQAEIVSDQQQQRSMATENAEIKAVVEEYVPKKFRTGHVFHAVRSVKDIASIVKSGLKKGTNLALDIMGQGVSMLGDVGLTVLVFEDDKGAYTTKGYQNDGVANGGMKPVAIITDETDAAVISELKKTGLPVYSNGKRNVTVTKKTTKKPDVKGAAPADVFDREQNITGAEVAQMKKDMDAETLDEAFEKAGVSKAAAKKIRGAMGVLDKNGKLALTKIAEEFNVTGDMVRFATQFEKLVGKVPSPALIEAYTEFLLAINEQESLRPETSEDALDNLYDDRPDMTENERFIAEQTGAIAPRIDEESTVVDEWNVPYAERLRSLYDLVGGRLLGKSEALSKADKNILQRAYDKLNGRLGGVESVKMSKFIDMMLEVLPKNHRFSFLLQQIKRSGLELDINIVSKEDEIVLNAEGKEKSKGGGTFTPDYASPENSFVQIFTNEGRSGFTFFRTATHELLHAVTVFRYATDAMFRGRIDTLWKKTVLKLLSNSATFDPALFEDLTEGNSSGAYNYILQFLMSEPGDINSNTINALYGLTSPKEFMAEAFTNLEFQEILAGIKTEPHGNLKFMSSVKNFLKVFLNELKKTLGMSIRNTVLEEVLILSANNFDTAASYSMAANNVQLQESLQRGKLNRSRASGPPVSNEGKYDKASLTALVSKALALKTRAKEILKAARADNALDRKGMAAFEKDDVVTRNGRAIRQSKKAIELLSIGLEAADNGRRHVIQDHLERSEEYLSSVDQKFQKETLQSVQVEEDIPDKKVRSTVVNDTADAYRQRDKTVMQSRETLIEKIKALPRSINLGFMNRDVIERNYRELFARAGRAAGHVLSPLTIYIKMKQKASQIAEEYAQRANAALQKLQKLDNKTRSKVFAMMRDTTLAQVWPHVALTHKLNDHLWTKPDKEGVSKLSPELGKAATKARKEWVALHRKDPKAAELLIEMANLTRTIQDRKRLEALRTTGKVYQLDAALIKQLGELESHKDIMKMFPGMYDKDGRLIDTNDESARPADTIKQKGDSTEVKEQKEKNRLEWVKRRSIAKTAEEIVKGTSINGPYFPLRRYGKYVVSSTEDYNENNEPYVSFHHTRKEAERVAAGLEKDLKIPTYITKKIESMAIPRDVESVTSELAKRMGSRKDGVTDYMGMRLQAAMIEIMADNTAYASQLKRHGVDGVASDDMGRAFEEYVFVAKYTLGDLATAHEVHQALKDLKSLQSKGAQDVLRRDAATEEEVLLIGDVVNELAAQNREDAKDREMSNFQKGVGLIGFFNFLGAPSYWVLNATQTLTVTLPYIGAKFGNVVRDGKKISATGAYYAAAATVLKAAKGAKSYEQFKSNLPDAAQKVVAELEQQGIIQSTIAHELGDIMSPSFLTSVQNWAGPVGKATATALKLMETIPESVEKYNRISTALAIYNLSDGNMTAVADGVQATQFNYDSANRARLMKAAPEWAGGGLRAIITPMMMFKSYGIGLTRLLYGNMAKAVVGKTAAERSEGRKLAGGLIVSHSVFGGVAGGVMIAPVQAIVWAFNEAFREAGDEFDPEEAVELYLQDVANDTVAALAARGLPAAFGLELSKSINLGNLIWMGNDRINLNDAGGVETMVTTALGPVAQWGITSVREGARLFSDDPRGNWYDFAAAAIPLKMARGTIRGFKYEMEGIGTDTLTFVKPDDVSGWIRLAMGFRPTNIAMTTDLEYRQMGRDRRRSTRKSWLIDRALKADTPRKRAAVWDDIEDFNKSLEKRGDWINRGDVAKLRSSRRSRQYHHDRQR